MSLPQISAPLTPRPVGSGTNALPPGTPELRLAPADFTTQPIGSAPDPRTISNVVAGGPQALANDPVNSAWLYTFGQFIDHDLSLEALNPAVNIDLPVPNGDPVFPDGSTIPLGGSAGPNAINTVAGYLDLSQVYGSDAATAANLRNADGTLATSHGDTVPVVNRQFVSGDVRVGENPELSSITSMFVRYHNILVAELAAQHPDWTGHQLYDTAKEINTAIYQNVIYTEYLPALIGPGTLSATSPGFRPDVSANVSMEFATAAFRVGHSQVSGTQTGIDKAGNEVFSQSLADAFFDTPAQVVSNGVDALLRNLSNDFSQQTDVYAVDELRNLLSDGPQQMDLIAIDIQRERDLGLATLNDTRAALGLAPYTSFAEITSEPTVAANLQTVYGTVDKVDLFMGGLAEDHAPGATVGQTFKSIIADQFFRLRVADAYFWQNQSLSPDLKAFISQTTLGDVIEATTGTPVEQQNVFIAALRVISTLADPASTSPQLVIGVDDAGANIAGGLGDDTIVAGLGDNQVPHRRRRQRHVRFCWR